jgi:2'-5' RNA ligase
MSVLRAFIAVDVDNPEVVGKVVEVQRELERAGQNGLKNVEPENLHLTLRFLGEIDEADVKVVKAALEFLDVKPFTLEFRGLGYFPGGGRVNVVWAGVEGDVNVLRNVFEKVEGGLRALKLERERFSPHLTICRVKYVRDRQSLFDVIAKHSNTYFGRQHVYKISLKKSTLTPTGPIYSDVWVKKLG